MTHLPEPGTDPLIGCLLADRYKIVRQIGEGGMGLVYEAQQITIGKRVAVKVLRDDFSQRPEVVERFHQEARSATMIGNEHIVDISDFGATPAGSSYFVMEFLEGEDLANVLSRDGVITLERAAYVLFQCCRALGAAHEKGIVHRDMKPENIFLTERAGQGDFVKIVDFGIAKMSDVETPGAPGRKLTKTGMIFGTPEYMSPEQAAGKELDHRVDIYALGVIMYEMLTGRVPFVGDTFMGVLTQHMFDSPPDFQQVNPHCEVSDGIASFIYKAMAKDPDDRFQDCDEMGYALEAALGGKLVGASNYDYSNDTGRYAPARVERHDSRAATVAMQTEPRSGSRFGLLGGGVLALLAAGGGAMAGIYLSDVGPAIDGADAQIPIVETSQTAADSGAGTPTTNVLALVADGPETALAAGPETGPDPLGVEAVAIESIPDAGPSMVTLNIESEPSAATVQLGDEMVCEATPCQIQTPAGEEITLRARRGPWTGRQSVVPTEDDDVHLRLRRRTRRNNTTQSPSRSGHLGDLKMPPLFQNP